MAANFRISLSERDSAMHVKLKGDFDGISAYQLLNSLKKRCEGAKVVFIHTTLLGDIHPFGLAILGAHLNSIKAITGKLVFLGAKAGRILEVTEE